MSYTTVHQAAYDPELQERTAACAQTEARNGANAGGEFAGQIRAGYALIGATFDWPVAIDNQAAYESAVLNGNPSPGGDPAVITDAAILSAVQAAWPPDA
jgi:hypothetical protein